MTDLFLEAIRDLHAYRAKVRAMTPERRAQMFARLDDDEADAWLLTARDEQLPPPDIGWGWTFLGGRGAGKTHAGSSAIHMAQRAGVMRMGAVGPSAAAIDAIILDGPSGLMATAGIGPRPRLLAYKRRLEWPNGAMCGLFSAEEPDSLRGHQFELVWIDELALLRYAEKVFDNVMLGLRLGEKPRLIATTTPRPSAFLKGLIKMEGMSVTRASTFANRHLSEDYLKRVRTAYEGTETGRQELAGELILAPRDALFRSEWFRHEEIANEKIEQATVAVDPSGGADLVGIVGAALLTDGSLAVLGDYSTGGTPSHWAETAIRAHDQLDADDICAETNFGGAMVIETIKLAAIRMHERGERQTDMIRVREVVASKGKTLRAEPVSLQYERRRVIHRKGADLNKLEAEMLGFSRDWDRARDGSPNRTDAAVWALTRLNRIVTNIPIA